MTPLPAFLALTAALLAAAGAGVAAGRFKARREFAAHREYLAALETDLRRTERELAAAQQAVQELRDAIPKVWDAGAEAARQRCQYQHASDGIQVWELSAEFLERLRANRRHN